MKQTATNEFKDGLNLDLHPIVTPKTVLTDNLNGTFITYNGNEFCLQNDRGNKSVANLTTGYTPIGIKEHNGILYIVSVNGNKTEIGTYPCPNYPSSAGAYDYEHKQNLLFQYAPLHVLSNKAALTNINFGYTINTPLTIDVQDSYDGSVNLIIVTDQQKPRIINSGFSVLPNDTYKFVNRKQDTATNIYSTDKIAVDTELIRTSSELTRVALGEPPVQSGGQLKGGNYTFYIKFGDEDFNQTDVVAESGIVSIFNGNDGAPSTISGTLLDERTDKMAHLVIHGLNHVYSKIYIYFTREYSDTQGFRMTECGMLTDPIDMVETGISQDIWITGFEQQTPINIEELNVDYHTIDWARAESQHSNMLFLGNIGQKETFDLYKKLEAFTLTVNTTLEQTSFTTNAGDGFSNKNYYSVANIYNKLGYWPNEYYRFGIVYILDDGSTTPVFNMHGGRFTSLTDKNNSNDYGVFLTPNVDILKDEQPLSFKFTLPSLTGLGEYQNRIKGWFVVRQKRIPTTICQGLSIGTDKRCHLPTIWTSSNNWYIESFLSLDRSQTEGERWRHESGDASIHQISGERHILRPFLETFETNKTSVSYGNVGSAQYVVNPTKTIAFAGQIVSEVETGENDSSWSLVNGYVKRIDAIKAQIGYNSSTDIFVTEPNIEECWANDVTPRTLGIWKFTINNTRNGDNFVSSSGTLYYAFCENGVSTSPGTYVDASPTSFYIAESAPSSSSTQYSLNKFKYRFIKELNTDVNKNALLSLDPCVNSLIGSTLDGSKFTVKQEYNTSCTRNNILFNYNITSVNNSDSISDCKTVFISEGTKSKVLDDNNIFSTFAGSGSSAGDFEYAKQPFGVKTDADGTWLTGYTRTYKKDTRVNDSYGTSDYYGYNSTHNVNLIRGLFTPYVGLGSNLTNYGIYSIRVKDITYDNAVTVRKQDSSEFYCVSDRTAINTSSVSVYRGDCYICRVGIRILRNFIDGTAPVTNTIVDPLGWERWVRQRSLYGGDDIDSKNGGKDSDSYASIVNYNEVNLSDLNAIDLGYWVTFPCLSSYNLGLRSEDRFRTDEMALLGSPRSFYPLSGASAINKVGDSYLLNDGYSATVGRKRYNTLPDTPYSRSEFANRIMFSNVNITDTFTNGYRTFQGLSYRDYDKQYGAITKLIPLGQNLFVVMEHGLGLVPVNPKALMQTTTGEAIHIYGYGVLPDEMTIISQDYGSKYEHSVIRTPIGIYGLDVDARKVWRFSDKQGFETISDMKIETYLKDHLETQEKVIEMGISDIRTHYNAKKGDLMFTWYDNQQLCSVCYNERQNIWVTRYDWCPIVSENINDEYYSLNKSVILNDNCCHIWDHKYNVAYKTTNVSSWYDGNHPFEFEFIVSDPIGVSKIFDNLQIISNNVQPNELEITVLGDDYMFKRDELTFTQEDYEYPKQEYPTHISSTTSNIHDCEDENTYNPLNDEVVYKWDWRLHQNAICKTQKLKDIYEYGRRMGNIQYKNGMWYIQIEPLRMQTETEQQMKEIRIRDKWAKIRIRYSGKDLAIITAIRTLINI